jgi:hypothetical protein
MVSRNHKSSRGPAAHAYRERQKKSQADQPAWPFWLKLSAGGQLDGYFE